MATKVSSNGTVNRISGVLDAPPTMKPEVVTFKVIGISPLLQNNPTEFIGVTDSGSLATKKEYNDKEEAAKRVYKIDGSFGHPSEAFIRSMVRAVTGKKFGKKSAPALLKGAVFTVESHCVIEGANGKPLKKYEIDRRSVIVNKARILRCRPRFDAWQTKVALEIDTAILTPQHVLDALLLAGRTVGVGDFRPEKGGPYGRFTAEIV